MRGFLQLQMDSQQDHLMEDVEAPRGLLRRLPKLVQRLHFRVWRRQLRG